MLQKFNIYNELFIAKIGFTGFIKSMNVSFSCINFYGKNPVNLPKTSELKGSLNQFDINLVSEIKDLFELAHSSIKAVSKSCNTRNCIKNGYERLKKGIAGSRILEFPQIGEKGEDISVNVRLDHGKTKKTVIIIGDTPLVINPKGQIEKNPTMRFARESRVRQKGEVIEYYTQEEIDRLNPSRYLYALKKELNKYIEYINARCREINNIRKLKEKNIEGSVDKYSELIDAVTDGFKYFKTHINKLSEKALDKDIFRIVNKVKTFPSQNSILLKDATPDGRSLYLVYSIINKKTAMKLFLMDYGNKRIDKSFIIYNNKLAKYSPKKVNSKPAHLEYDFHYYSQEEIDNLELEYYLNLAKNRLTEVNDNLNLGINERLG